MYILSIRWSASNGRGKKKKRSEFIMKLRNSNNDNTVAKV